MKHPYCPALELGRVVAGPLASEPGARCGAFLVLSWTTNQRLQVIVQIDFLGWDVVALRPMDRRRSPTLPEIRFVQRLFFEPRESVAVWLPSEELLTNPEPYVVHLWHRTVALGNNGNPVEEGLPPFELACGYRVRVQKKRGPATPERDPVPPSSA